MAELPDNVSTFDTKTVRPLSRQLARAALLSRMKVQGTSADATDLIGEIRECLALAEQGKTPTFQIDLQTCLVKEILRELRSGRIESFGFERLIQTVLRGLGAEEVSIFPRSEDKGADLLAMFRVASVFQQRVAVQAKHWQPEPPVGREVVEQLIRGIEAESANRPAWLPNSLIKSKTERGAVVQLHRSSMICGLDVETPSATRKKELSFT